jgi:hypothetical protein
VIGSQAAAALDATMSDLGASRLMLARQRGADGVVRWSAVLMREHDAAQAHAIDELTLEAALTTAVAMAQASTK